MDKQHRCDGNAIILAKSEKFYYIYFIEQTTQPLPAPKIEIHKGVGFAVAGRGSRPFLIKKPQKMELTKLRKDLQRGKLFAFESILTLYLENPQAGFADGEAQILEKCLYQIKINGGTPEVDQVLMDSSADELREYYENSEKILKMLKNL